MSKVGVFLHICILISLSTSQVSLAQVGPEKDAPRLWIFQLSAGAGLSFPYGDYYSGSGLGGAVSVGAHIPLGREIGLFLRAFHFELTSDKDELKALAGSGDWKFVKDDYTRQLTTIELSFGWHTVPRLPRNIAFYWYLGAGVGFLSHRGEFIVQNESDLSEYQLQLSDKTVLTGQGGVGLTWYVSKKLGVNLEYSAVAFRIHDHERREGEAGQPRLLFGLVMALPQAR